MRLHRYQSMQLNHHYITIGHELGFPHYIYIYLSDYNIFGTVAIMESTTNSFENMAQYTRVWDFPKLKGQSNYQSWAKSMLNGLEYGGIALLNMVVDGGTIFLDDLPEEVVEMVVPEGGGEPITSTNGAV